jgi:hypothetical protein
LTDIKEKFWQQINTELFIVFFGEPVPMKKILLLALTSFLAISAQADNSQVFRSKAKYMKYVGTYFVVNETLTINSDGTQTTVNGNMFSSLDGGGRRATPAKGVWQETGKNEIVVTNIRFSTDSSGNYEGVGLIRKATFTINFDEPVQGRCLGFTVRDVLIETYIAGQNPITDEPIVANRLEGGARGNRLEPGYPES